MRDNEESMFSQPLVRPRGRLQALECEQQIVEGVVEVFAPARPRSTIKEAVA